MTGKDLKNSILQLAIQGKLVPQDPNDEPASELLARIRKEKEKLVKEKKLKKKDLEATPIADEEKPFEIPESWEWVKIQDVFTINPKVNFADDNTEAAFIPMEKIEAGYGSSFSYEVAKWGKIKKNYTCFADGDVAFAKITPCFQNRKSLILEKLPNGIGAGTTELKVLRQYGETIDRKYVLYFLQSSYFIDEATFKGTANQQRIVVGYLENKPFPLPPLAEQQRIVSKIEELMPLVEEYDKYAKELNDLDRGLPSRLRQSVLQQAIMGKLVPQDPDDEPASELLARIRKEKETLLKEKKLKKKDLEVTPISEDEKPFEIPEGWEWVRLGDIGITNTGTTPSKANLNYYGDFIPFLGPGDIREGIVNYHNNALSVLGYQVARPVQKGTILQVCIGGSIGKCAVVDREVTFNQQINSFTSTLVSYKYMFFCLQSDYFQKKMLEYSTGTATPIINRSSWDLLEIPLPPLAEQQRIVAKIEELFSMIDNIKTC